MIRGALIALTLAVTAGSAAARPGVPGGAAWLHYEASYAHRLDREQPARAGRGVAMAGVRLDALLGGGRLAYVVGVDLAAGATVPAGFAYQTDVYLGGVAVRIGATGAIGVAGGVGASGAVGTLDDGLDLPVTALLELPLGARLRLIGRGRATWLVGAPGRAGGAVTAPWTDEVDAWLGLRWGRRYHGLGFPSGNGTFVAVSYREREGARMVGVVLGYSVDLGAPRR
ncbi:MAG: hypothetical protein IPL61_00505 [Myxococcales bacterium]|nr:hypothetical protein [Myxococcales bacterium]